ncbi:hypothetical protein AAG906_010770 [Vitis piasezkii]
MYNPRLYVLLMYLGASRDYSRKDRWHIKRECRKFRREQFKGKGEEQKDEKNIAAIASDGDTIIVCDDACVNLACQDSTWVVDIAALFHITTHGSFGWVRIGNEVKREIIGMGDVKLETSIRCKLVLKDVRHVLEMRFSLISIGKLDDEGYHSHLGEGKWKLTKGSLTEAKLVKGEVNIVKNVASIELWHKRLGHINNGGEYRRPFEQYCKSHGIKLEKTVPKTPQQNGVAERMNRTTVIESGPRYKARLVMKGFSQKKDIDFEEIFSLVVKMSSIRVVLGLAISMNLEIEQLDVKTTFLHGDLEEEIYWSNRRAYNQRQ